MESPSDRLDLSKFIAELHRETDRGLPLVGAALIDEKLSESLRAFFCAAPSSARLLDGANAPLGSFSARIEACQALGLIDELEYSEIHLIRKVRNAFAHAKHGMDFSNPRVKGLCSSLQADLPEGAGLPIQDPRFRFTNSVIVVVLRLYYRPEWVALERRKPKIWVDPKEQRWRSVNDELPEPGQHVLVMVKPST